MTVAVPSPAPKVAVLMGLLVYRLCADFPWVSAEVVEYCVGNARASTKSGSLSGEEYVEVVDRLARDELHTLRQSTWLDPDQLESTL
jgi:hypothetical protein